MSIGKFAELEKRLKDFQTYNKYDKETLDELLLLAKKNVNEEDLIRRIELEHEKVVAKLTENTYKVSFPRTLIPGFATFTLSIYPTIPSKIHRLAFSKSSCDKILINQLRNKYTILIEGQLISEAFTDPGSLIGVNDDMKQSLIMYPGITCLLDVTNKSNQEIELEAWLAVYNMDMT